MDKDFIEKAAQKVGDFVELLNKTMRSPTAVLYQGKDFAELGFPDQEELNRFTAWITKEKLNEFLDPMGTCYVIDPYQALELNKVSLYDNAVQKVQEKNFSPAKPWNQ